MFAPANARYGYTVHWAVDDTAQTVSMAVVAERTSGWVAVGFSPDGQMTGSDAVIGWSGGGSSVLMYEMSGRRVSGVNEISGQVSDTSISVEDGRTTMTFTRSLATPSALPLDSATFLWAVGPSEGLSQHAGGDRGAFPLALSGSAAGALAIPNIAFVQLAHGLCMLIGWGLLLPIGAAMAVLKERVGAPLWFQLHRGLQVVGLLVAIVGFSLAVANFESDLGAHGTLGITVMVLGLFQPINGVLRPHKDKDGAHTSRKRALWEATHKGVGWLTLALAAPTIALGATKLEDLAGVHFPNGGTAIGVTYAIVGGLVVVVLLLAYAAKLSGRSGVKGRSLEVTTSDTQVEISAAKGSTPPPPYSCEGSTPSGAGRV